MLPYPTQSISGVNILSSLAALNQSKGNRAVLLGSNEQLDSLTENFLHNPDPVNMAAQAKQVLYFDTDELLNSLGMDTLQAKKIQLDQTVLEHRQNQSQSLADHSLLIAIDPYTGKSLQKIMAAVLPIEFSWLAPCYLRFETFHLRGMLGSLEHSALLKRWCTAWNAQVIALTYNSIELVVDTPPTTEQEAVQLAKEFSVYCPDLIDHGAHPLGALAAQLLGARHWYFSWF